MKMMIGNGQQLNQINGILTMRKLRASFNIRGYTRRRCTWIYQTIACYMQPSSIIGNEIHIQREQLSYFYVKLDTSY